MNKTTKKYLALFMPSKTVIWMGAREVGIVAMANVLSVYVISAERIPMP